MPVYIVVACDKCGRAEAGAALRPDKASSDHLEAAAELVSLECSVVCRECRGYDPDDAELTDSRNKFAAIVATDFVGTAKASMEAAS